MGLVDTYITYSEGRVDEVINKVDKYVPGTGEIYRNMNKLKEVPVQLAKKTFDEGVSLITAPIKNKIRDSMLEPITNKMSV